MNDIYFRASGAGNLMVGTRGLTTNQKQRLAELTVRKKGEGKPLTAKMEKERLALARKKRQPFELSQTAKSWVENIWLAEELGYRPPMDSKEVMKGKLVEQDAFALVDQKYPGTFRAKNTNRFTKGHFSGTPDTILGDVVEDVKSCWDLRTFFRVRTVDPLYYAQGQVYMYLTGNKKYRLHYTLSTTPEELIWNEEKTYFYKYGSDYENQLYLEASAQIRRGHEVDHIPAQDRVKTFTWEYDPAFMRELNVRAKAAKKYYNQLRLNKIEDWQPPKFD